MSQMLDKKKFRLPKNASPTKYKIELHPDLEAKVFEGKVEILLNILEESKNISINVADLEIKTIILKKDSAEIDNSISWDIDNDYEIMSINFEKPISTGEYSLSIEFSGILNDKLRGFYHSSFKDHNDNIQSIATTQFESTDARRAFPCFDEPEYKSVFSVSLILENELFCVSNAAEKNIDEEYLKFEGKTLKKVEFHDTIPMSTYLVAFIVGPFEASKEINVNGTNLRIIYPIGKGHLCDFALELGEYALDYFSKYYKIPYPGDKLDMIAVPDFAFGAMENLGCITYREALLLVDTDQATSNELIRIADVICHEIAHMWFGDLVTMKWWNGIWLNEAFATFMATKAVADYNKDWDRWAQFSLEKSMAMDIDSLNSTRPIEYPVISPTDADGMFDLITYEKGGSILRMLEQFLGENLFRDGVSHYLTKHSYGNTETDDLWDSLEKISKLPVKKIMDTWIFQPGHPIISYSFKNNSININQKIFKYIEDAENNTIWGTPIFIKYKENNEYKSQKFLLDKKSDNISLPIIPDEILLNSNAYGFYRVNNNFKSNGILTKNYTSEEKYSLIDDYWSLVLNGSKNPEEFIEFCESFNDELDPDILGLLYSCFTSLNRSYKNKNIIHKVVKIIFENSYNELLNLSNRSVREIQSLAISFRALCIIIKDENVINLSGKIFDNYVNHKKQNFEPDIISSVISINAFFGDEKVFDKFVNLMENAKTPQDEVRFQRSLALFQDEQNINKLFQFILEDKIRSQDSPYLLASALNNETNGWMTWLFISNNWEILTKKFPENSIVRMLSGIRALNHRKYLTEIKKFFEDPNKIKQGKLQLDQHLEKLEINVRFRERI